MELIIDNVGLIYKLWFEANKSSSANVQFKFIYYDGFHYFDYF